MGFTSFLSGKLSLGRVGIRGHSLTTLTRLGGLVVQKCQLFVNSYRVENMYQRRGVGGQHFVNVLKNAP